jgi:predicted transglutaminase-like cysteine proteinase
MFDRIVHGIAVLLTLLPFVLLDRAFAQSQPNAVDNDRATFAERFSAYADAPATPAPPASPTPPALTAPAEHSMRAPTPEPFALNVEPVTAGGVLDKWNGLVADMRAEDEILARCRDDAQHCPPAAKKFLAVIAEGRAHEGRARIGVINRAINMAIQPMSDLAQWGVVDRWSAPLATLATGRGDCEDYAIAKYVALRAAGVAEKDVRLIIVRDLASGDDHAVTAARVDEKWIVLDNRRLALVEDTAMAPVEPMFVFDDAGVQRFAPATAQAHRAPAEMAAAAPAKL